MPRSDRRAGAEYSFRLEPAEDSPFDRRLVLDGAPAGWVLLSYRTDPALSPLRPMLRALRRDGSIQDLVLPGGARARWLGLLPPDTEELRLAAAPGFVLDRVERRSEAGILLECLRKRPLRAVSALYERARGDARRYRDTLRGACAVTPLSAFPRWAAERAEPPAASASARTVRVIVAGGGDDAALERTLASVRAQTHPHWAVSILSDQAAAQADPDPRVSRLVRSAGLTLGTLVGADEALCLLQPGDALVPDALAHLAAALGGASLAYGDEVRPDGMPRLKPGWSPDLALAGGYLGRPWLATRARLASILEAPLPEPADLDIALARGEGGARHVPRVLARTAGPDVPAETRADALRRSGIAITMRSGVPDLAWPLPEPAPLASIVIPSRDRLDLIRRVCQGVLHETAYPAIELVVVDNGSTDAEVLAHYEVLRADSRVTILSDPAPFNFSRLVNAGVAAARGSLVVLLNNDIAVLEPGWLDAMVRQALRPEVGAVGAKLLYADGRLQHAGVVVGLGGRAGHILRRRPGNSPGHLGRLRVAHEVSAVTAACLAVTRDKYEAVGGFDAEAFPVDFNDVDFCLRLGARGYKTVWTPQARLAHLESVSRGPAVGAARARFEAEGDRFAARWRDVIRHDPFYHPRLSLTTFGEDLE